MSVFVHAQRIKTVHAVWWGVKKGKNSVHIDVECPQKNQNLFHEMGLFVCYHGIKY
jgi:hypothetical protein